MHYILDIFVGKETHHNLGKTYGHLDFQTDTGDKLALGNSIDSRHAGSFAAYPSA